MKQYMHVMRNILLVALLALSASMASVAADFCWKDTQTRGVGTIPKSCTDGKEYKDGLCYTPCKAGMNGVGPVCWSACPAGYIDMGAICHIDKALLKEGSWECTEKWGDTCMWKKMTCPGDYTNIGLLCALTSVPTPAGFSGTYLDPMKNTYGRGAGTIPTGCADDQQYDAGLCYTKCGLKYSGVGPVCWGQTPKGWVGCGMGAASSGDACHDAVSDQVSSVGEAALNIATLGAGSAATKPLRFKRLRELYKAAKEKSEKFREAVSKARETQGRVGTLLGVLETSSSGEELSDVEFVALAANVASLADPSGVSGIIVAYAHPVCSKLGLDLNEVPVPTVKPPPPPRPVPLCICTEVKQRLVGGSYECVNFGEGQMPGENCKYTAEMAHHWRTSPQTCFNNPLCGGPEKAPGYCLDSRCLTPGAPTDATAVIKGTSAVISFKAPEGIAGTAVNRYWVKTNRAITEGSGSDRGVDSNTDYLRADGTASPVTVTGLTPGTAYKFVVRGETAWRAGVESKPSNMVGIPLPPSANSVRPSPPYIEGVQPSFGGELLVSFSLVNDGGSPVTGFSTTCHTYDKNGVDASASGPTSPLLVKGLTPGNWYQCSVLATNKNGSSLSDAHSLSNPVKAP
jgi:hypothetical protein